MSDKEAIRKFGSEYPHRLDECKVCGLTWGEHCDTDCPKDIEAERAARCGKRTEEHP